MNEASNEERLEWLIKTMLDRCEADGAVRPYDVIMTNARQHRVGVRAFKDRIEPLTHQATERFEFCPPFEFEVTDAAGMQFRFGIRDIPDDAGHGSASLH